MSRLVQEVIGLSVTRCAFFPIPNFGATFLNSWDGQAGRPGGASRDLA